MNGEPRIVKAALDRQTPYPTPESVVANFLADGRADGPSGSTRKLAQKITNALRAAGWRILR